MKSIESIAEYYEQLELHDGSWIFSTNTVKALSKLESLIKKESIKSCIKWERAVLGYSIKKGKLVPYFSTTGKDGIVHSNPNMSMFNNGGLEYLAKRSEEMQNNYLVAHFSHVLWNSSEKNLEHANRALDSYLSYFESIRESSEIATYNKIELIKNIGALSIDSNSKTEEVKSFFNKLLFDKEFWSFGWQISLLRFMLESKSFKKRDFVGTIDLIQSINKSLEQVGDYSSIHDNLEVALRIADKTQYSKKELTRSLGAICEKIAEERSDLTSKMVALMSLSEALFFYESINDNEGAERVSVEITELKKVHELAQISIPLNDSKLDGLNGVLKDKANLLLKQDSLGIYVFLSNNNPLLFPNIENIKSASNTKEFRLFDLFQKINFDINSNVSKSEDQEKEKSRVKFVQSYSLYINFSAASFLFPLFIDGVRSGKINYISISSYLRDQTWFGERLTENRNGEKIEFSWLEIIAPSVQEFFKQFELMNSTGDANFTLVLDSLTIKFEGILRDFAKLLGAKTLTATRKHNKFSTREMYLEDLLRQEKVQEYFDESDRAFFSYLFLGGGRNVRNNVAHCFYKPSDYDLSTSLLLLLAILRLSKYTIR